MIEYIIATVVVVIFLFLFYFMLKLVDRMSLKKLKKDYNEQDDASRQGEEQRAISGRIETASVKDGTTELSNEGYVELGGQQVLPPSDVGSIGKDSQSPRGFFARRRK